VYLCKLELFPSVLLLLFHFYFTQWHFLLVLSDYLFFNFCLVKTLVLHCTTGHCYVIYSSLDVTSWSRWQDTKWNCSQ
jgi:hypothetical protein